MLDRRSKQPRRRQNARMPRDQHVANAKLRRQRDGMDRPGTTERNQREMPRIAATTDRHEANALDHLRIHHAMDAKRRVFHRQTERSRDPLLDRRARQRQIQRD